MAKKTAKKRRPRRDPDEVDPILHLEEDEVLQMMKAAADLGRNGERDSAMILMAFHHGLRASECCRFRWERVWLKKGQIYVTRAKGSKSGTHELWPEDVTALKALDPQPAGYVFRSEAKQDPGPVSESGFFRIVRRAGKAAGLGAKCHPHQLRHACGHWMFGLGFEQREIQIHLGHRNIQNAEHYTAVGDTHMSDRWKQLMAKKRKYT